MKGQLDRTLAEKQSVEADLAGQLDSLTEQLERVSSEKDQSEKRLNGQLDDLHKNLISEYSGGFGDMGLKLSSSVCFTAFFFLFFFLEKMLFKLCVVCLCLGKLKVIFLSFTWGILQSDTSV